MKQDVTEDTTGGSIAEEICGALTGVLHDGVDIHRCLAAQALGQIGDRRAVTPLIEALLDEDEDVRTDVAGALLVLADPRAARQLLENLIGDPCTDVKLAAIDALVRFRDPAIVPWLRRLIKGRDEDIVWDESEFYENGWDDWVDIQVKAIDGLAEMDVVEAIPEFIEAMEDENGQDLSKIVFRALSRLADPGVEALAGFLENHDERLRRRAVAALAETDNKKAYWYLEQALKDSAPMVRLAALQAIAGRNSSDPVLASMFEDETPELRAEAVRLCATAHPERLSALADDPADQVQKAVMEILVQTPDLAEGEEWGSLLKAKLDSSNPQLAASAALALASVAPQISLDDLIAVSSDVDRPIDARLGALRGLSLIGSEPAVQSIIPLIADRERPLRIEVMATLAAIARADAAWPNPAGEALLQALQGELAGMEKDAEEVAADVEAPASEASSEEAAEVTEVEDSFPTSTLHSIMSEYPDGAKALDVPEEGIELTPMDMERLALAKRIKGKKCLPVVPKVAPYQDIRRFAARVLGDLSNIAVADALAEALSDDDQEVRRAAADSLARVAAQAGGVPTVVTDALLATLGETDRNLRLSVVRALGAAGDDRIADILKDRLGDDDSFVRTEAVRALSAIGDVGTEVEALLEDPDPAVRLAAAEAVAGAGSEGSIDRLVRFAFAFEGYHRREAGRLLRRIDVPVASTRFVQSLADDTGKRTWPVGIEALEELNRPFSKPGN